MDFRLLKHMATLADTLHFGRASELCHISPSTLSRSIQQVESELGTRLFERDNRHVTLTPQGVAFLRYAKQTLEQWETQKRTLATSATQKKSG
jgi:LysR family positive regulator for ilvC